MGGIKDAFRAAALKTRSNVKVVEVSIDGETQRVGLRQPSVADREAILKAGGLDAKGNVTNFAAMNVKAVMLCVVDPDTRQAIFTDHDRDVLMSQPSGGWVDTLGGEAMALMAPEKKPKRCPKCEKPSQHDAAFCSHCGERLVEVESPFPPSDASSSG